MASKNVLLTGSSGGMGFEIAKRFISEGYSIYGLDINSPFELLENFTFIKTDITKETEVIKAFQILKDKNIKLDVIINAAGIYNLDSLIEISEEDFIKIFDINVFSMYRINKTFLPLLSEGGKIIMISSELAPLDPLPFTGIYAISKSTVEKYAYSLRMELQLLGYQVVLIRPGAIDTKMIDVSTTKLDKFVDNTTHYKTNSARFKKIVDGVENKKIHPSKIADLVYKVNTKKKPKYVYKINRNAGLIILDILPDRLQNYIIRKILTK